MNSQAIDYLAQRHGYETWRGRNTLEENLLVWRFFVSGNELPGWRPHRIQTIDVPGQQPFLQSIWQRLDGGTEALLQIDIFETPSREVAHGLLLRLLGQHQTPLVEREERAAVGDVAFVVPRDSSVAFARANLAVLMRNAGRELVPVTPIASELDANLAATPRTGETKVVPEIHRFEFAMRELRPSISVPLELDASDPLERPVWFKFFSSTGELLVEDGRVAYRPTVAGTQQVVVYALNANGGVAHDVAEATVEDPRSSGTT